MSIINFSHSFYFCGNAIEATVTNKAYVIHEWLEEVGFFYHGYLHPMIVVGLDCKFVVPRNHIDKGGVPERAAATLQLCLGNKCLLVQLLYLDDVPPSLDNFFNDPNIIFVGADVDNDLKILRRDFGLGFASSTTSADVQDIAMQRWPMLFHKYGPSLEVLAQLFSGLSMSTPPLTFQSLWNARLLCRKQVEYACSDAYAAYIVGQKLLLSTMDHMTHMH